MNFLEKTYVEAIREAIHEELETNKNFVLLGQDIGEMGGVWGQTKDLQKRFGKMRVIDSPIAEATMVGIGIGASINNLKMLIDIQRIDFLPVAMSPIVNEMSKISFMTNKQTNISCVIYSITGAMTNAGPQHSQSLENLFLSIPNIRVVIPSNAYEAKGLLKSSFKSEEPVLFFSPVQLQLTKAKIPEMTYILPLNKAKLLKNGEKATIVSYGFPCYVCEELIKKENYEVELIDLRSISPIDFETIIDSLKRTKNLLILQEAYRNGGVCEHIISYIQEHYPSLLENPVKTLCTEFSPIPYSKKKASKILLTREKIANFLKESCYKN